VPNFWATLYIGLLVNSQQSPGVNVCMAY